VSELAGKLGHFTSDLVHIVRDDGYPADVHSERVEFASQEVGISIRHLEIGVSIMNQESVELERSRSLALKELNLSSNPISLKRGDLIDFNWDYVCTVESIIHRLM